MNCIACSTIGRTVDIIVSSSSETRDAFCATCPVIDQTENSYIESSAAFTSECGDDNICKEELEVEVNKFISSLQ